MAYHALYIKRIIFWDVCEIATLRDKLKQLSRFLFYINFFVIVWDFSSTLQCFSCSKVRSICIWAVCGFWMDKIESCIQPNPNKKNSLSKLGDTILCKVV